MSTFENPLSAAERIAMQQKELEQPVVCPECGSEWFYEAEFNRYSALAYGAGAGADLRQINVSPQTLRVCLCGHPYRPNISGVRGRVASAELGNFNASLDKAHAYRNSQREPQVVTTEVEFKDGLVTKLGKIFAGNDDLEPLKNEIGQLRGLLAAQDKEIADVREAVEQVQVSTAVLGEAAPDKALNPMTVELLTEQGANAPKVPVTAEARVSKSKVVSQKAGK